MKFSLRLTLLAILLLLLGTTVSVVGFISYRHSRFTAKNLAQQLLEQAMERIESQIENKLGLAIKLNDLNERRIRSGQSRIDDVDRFVQYALGATDIATDLSGYFIGYESNGESVGVSRLTGKPTVWRSNLNTQREAYQVREYLPDDYPQHPFSFDPDKTTPDVRTRPWYQTAKQVGHPVWTNVFVFLGVEGTKDVHGLSYVTPIYGKNGELLAVLDADFELNQLSHFLATLKLGQTGFAYIVERQADGTQQVIAHPDTTLLMRDKSSAPSGARELITHEEFADPRVSALAKHLKSAKVVINNDSDVSFQYQADGAAYLGTVRTLDAATHPRWMICTVLPEAEVLSQVNRSVRYTMIIGISVLLLSIAIGIFVARQVSRPLERLALEANAIQRFQFKQGPPVHSIVREVDHLAVAIEDMKVGLRSFRKYIPAGLFHSFLTSKQEAVFGGKRQIVTIFFSDIVNFTTIAEEQPPEQLVDLLREYLNTVCEIIESTNGTVDKYIGDAVMAFWENAAASSNHALAACTTALRCQTALDLLNLRWEQEGKLPFRTRIGLNTGEVVVGNIGSDARFNYTIIGDAVNLSSRLEGLNKEYGTRILISDSTYQQALGSIVARPLDFVAVKGRRLPVLIYELIGLKADETDDQRLLIQHFTQGLQLYRNRDWEGAIAQFNEILRIHPDDRPSHALIEHCRVYQETPPEPNWDGSKHMTHK